MNTKPKNQGKLIIHGLGSGGVTHADVERRARELASIEGRDVVEPSAEDIAEAEAELSGQTVHPTVNDDGQSVGAMTRDPSDVPAFFDNQKGPVEDPDEQEAVERLALDGVEEAQHDQMIAARRAQRRQTD